MRALLFAVPVLMPRAAAACAVCFGQADGQKGFFNGLGWAILLLLAVTMSLVAAIGWAIWSVERARDARGA